MDQLIKLLKNVFPSMLRDASENQNKSEGMETLKISKALKKAFNLDSFEYFQTKLLTSLFYLKIFQIEEKISEK